MREEGMQLFMSLKVLIAEGRLRVGLNANPSHSINEGFMRQKSIVASLVCAGHARTLCSFENVHHRLSADDLGWKSLRNSQQLDNFSISQATNSNTNRPLATPPIHRLPSHFRHDLQLFAQGEELFQGQETLAVLHGGTAWGVAVRIFAHWAPLTSATTSSESRQVVHHEENSQS